ncbi:MAG: hypothetical protein QM820_35385 [Minicystis sp.]
MTLARFTFAALLTLATGALGAASCAKSDPVNNTGGAGGNGGNNGGSSNNGGALPTSICLLHNCSADIECEACGDGKNTCLVSEHRCVACDTGNNGGCPDGQVCSSWGNCAPPDVTCPTDNGVPTITCNANTDCAACDPAHQVCDPVAHKCVACTANDVSQCQSTDTCNGGDCAPKCPADCTSDADCSECGLNGHEAHFCNAHKCSECSPTAGCDGTLSCGPHGTCQEACGVSGAPTGDCASDADCKGCDGSANTCHVPIGGGKGKCGPNASGCSDLGNGVAVLPSPFDKVTNLCSNDMDCANVGIDLNVGKILRDLTGFEQIHDAEIMYPMHACASVQITDDKSCGVCVPCKVDSDCQNLDIDQFAGQAFGPLGAIASAFLLDQIFGDNDHQIHMYCETVAGDYGACVPCPGLLNDCSVGTPPDNNGNPCHDECQTGGPLGLQCGTCAIAVCEHDPYCCTGQWDRTCTEEVGSYCDKACEQCGQSDMGGHNKCQTGGALKETCSPCVEAICQASPDCCMSSWDQNCIDQVPQYCEKAYLCQGQCNDPAQCSNGDGCLADYTCGPCVADYDCFPKTCDTQSGKCQ